ncbi:MAG: LA_3696 family protein [Gemmatimonadota bacterium]
MTSRPNFLGDCVERLAESRLGREDVPIIEVPETLRERLGAEGTRALVDLFNQAARETRDDVVVVAEERFARRVAEAETRFEARLGQEVGVLRREVAAAETRLIRWSFVFWATLMAALFLQRGA